MKRMIALTAALSLSLPVLADESGPWTLTAGLGFIATSGNAEAANFSGSVDVGYKMGRWEHSLAALGLGAESENSVTNEVEATAERYYLGYKTKWDIRAHDYFFGGIDYDKDKFSGIDQSLSETIGYGRRFIDNDVQKLSGEVGFGFRQQDFRDGTDDSGMIITVGGDYLYNISETSAFTQGLTIEIGGDNTTTTSVTGLTFKMLDRTNLVLGYTIKNNTDVPAGSEKTDTFTSINLEYTF